MRSSFVFSFAAIDQAFLYPSLRKFVYSSILTHNAAGAMNVFHLLLDVLACLCGGNRYMLAIGGTNTLLAR